ncbi:unnamed protein product [Clonostachys chloroleuca]|uniref:Uncharacterized protein n=1 Tax=Clonostachys chloroleuca TaxID=1926264 RepID=A0AA35M3G0_9HYPO|nr:unnamed protein product [Clonostachys chloroleuca]
MPRAQTNPNEHDRFQPPSPEEGVFSAIEHWRARDGIRALFSYLAVLLLFVSEVPSNGTSVKGSAGLESSWFEALHTHEVVAMIGDAWETWKFSVHHVKSALINANGCMA